MCIQTLAHFFRVLTIASVLLVPLELRAQQAEPPRQAPEVVNAKSAAAARGTIDILYTGKLMGHFRLPDVQGPEMDGGGCPDSAPRSVAASDFDEILRSKLHIESVKNVILVGTGDNFAPEVEAREFCQAPKDQTGVKGRSPAHGQRAILLGH